MLLSGNGPEYVGEAFTAWAKANGIALQYIQTGKPNQNVYINGEAKAALAKDYAAMLTDEVMVGNALPFDELLKICAELEAKINNSVVAIDDDDQNPGRQPSPR